MHPTWQRDGISLYQGDALAVLREFSAGSVQCCVTSPPFAQQQEAQVAANTYAASSSTETKS